MLYITELNTPKYNYILDKNEKLIFNFFDSFLPGMNNEYQMIIFFDLYCLISSQIKNKFLCEQLIIEFLKKVLYDVVYGSDLSLERVAQSFDLLM